MWHPHDLRGSRACRCASISPALYRGWAAHGAEAKAGIERTRVLARRGSGRACGARGHCGGGAHRRRFSHRGRFCANISCEQTGCHSAAEKRAGALSRWPGHAADGAPIFGSNQRPRRGKGRTGGSGITTLSADRLAFYDMVISQRPGVLSDGSSRCCGEPGCRLFMMSKTCTVCSTARGRDGLTYRLVTLKSRLMGQRIYSAAAELGRRCGNIADGISTFYDDDVRDFSGLEQTGSGTHILRSAVGKCRGREQVPPVPHRRKFAQWRTYSRTLGSERVGHRRHSHDMATPSPITGQRGFAGIRTEQSQVFRQGMEAARTGLRQRCISAPKLALL